MMRECLHCHRPFLPTDLDKDISREIEGNRKSSGISGILFRCYACSHCGKENLFVDLHPLDGETPDELKHRRDELDGLIRQSPQPGVRIALVERCVMPALWNTPARITGS
jgi:hypothetical protein